MPATLAPTTDTCQASHELLLNRALSHSLTVCVFPTTGMLKMTINKFQSYDIHLELAVEGDVSRKAQGNLFLKEPNFRFMQFGAPPSMAPTDIAPPSQDAPVQVQQSSQ
eukprot:m.70581 g.70581  ORF g.70581 m.70581 type:complete len:109 (+) comp12263_c0_seq11:1331-1657(+)